MMAVVHPCRRDARGEATTGNERSVGGLATAGSGVALHADLDGPGRGPAAAHVNMCKQRVCGCLGLVGGQNSHHLSRGEHQPTLAN